MEAIVAFSDQFVFDIKSNQRVRYNQLMRAFTMSAAETARKTREFRSPPQDQVMCLEGGALRGFVLTVKMTANDTKCPDDVMSALSRFSC